jgi:hypothetical protein
MSRKHVLERLLGKRAARKYLPRPKRRKEK